MDDKPTNNKSAPVKRDYSMVRGLSIPSLTEDDMNTIVMLSKLERLRHKSSDSGIDENQEPICPSNKISPISHSGTIIEKQKPSRKQHKTERRNRAGTTKVLFKREICKKPSSELMNLRKVLVLDALESDTDSASENDENTKLQERIVYDPAILNFINNCENKENMDLNDFQAKLKL